MLVSLAFPVACGFSVAADANPWLDLWNVVIKAYTVADNIEKAREVFESLADPAAGVAAAGNHSSEIGASPREPGSVVYREPSTYECMIRAEVKIGSPEKAKELLNQAIGRAFPPAIIAKFERIVNGEDVSEVKFSSGGASNIV